MAGNGPEPRTDKGLHIHEFLHLTIASKPLFELCKGLFDWIEIRRIWGQKSENYACILAYICQFLLLVCSLITRNLAAMDPRSIHNKNRPGAWEWCRMWQNVGFDECFKQFSIIGALEDVPVQKTLTCIRWKDAESFRTFVRGHEGCTSADW